MTDAAFNRELKRLRKFFEKHVNWEVRRRAYTSGRAQAKRAKHERAVRRQRKRADLTSREHKRVKHLKVLRRIRRLESRRGIRQQARG